MHIKALILIGLFCSLAPASLRAEESEIQIHLITMGEAEHLYTRGGHASIMVAELEDGQPIPDKTIVYNYGDTYWEDPYLVLNFFRGHISFFLSKTGTLMDTVREYGARQGREVWRQRLNLTPAQVRTVANHLAVEVLPENREYPYHHMTALCSTKVRDLLNDVLGGTIQAQMTALDPMTPRDYQHIGFRDHPGIALAGDLFLGRLHDNAIDKYFALNVPTRMRDYLQQVTVPDPTGVKKTVPLAEPPVTLVESPGGSPTLFSSIFTTVVAIIAIVFIFGLGFVAYRCLPEDPTRAGFWLFVCALPFGLVGFFITLCIVFSGVPELRVNENILVFPPTDLLLLIAATRWLRGRAVVSGLFRNYAVARLVLAAGVVVAHPLGLLYQKPVILPYVGLAFAIVLLVLVRKNFKTRPNTMKS